MIECPWCHATAEDAGPLYHKPTCRHVHVVSTGRPMREWSRRSVAAQIGVNFKHWQVDASTQDPPRSVLENVSSVVWELPKDAVVCWLDGDDELAHPQALEKVWSLHAAGAWVTYGSFRYSDGRMGFADVYRHDEPVRTTPWRATHLRSFRAGLFQRIRPEEIAASREGMPHDMIVMMACIEMAGHDRAIYCPDVLCIYHLETSHEWRHGPAQERENEKLVRGWAPYERVKAL